MVDEHESKVAVVGKAMKKLKKLKKKKVHPVEKTSEINEHSVSDDGEANSMKKLTKKKKKIKATLPANYISQADDQVLPDSGDAKISKKLTSKKKKKIHPVENDSEMNEEVAVNVDEPEVKKANKKKKKNLPAESKNETSELVSPEEKGTNQEGLSKRAMKKLRPTGANSEISEQELEKLAVELMHSVKSLEELKKKVAQMSREGRVGGHQAGLLIRKWRVHDRQVNHLKKKEDLLNELSSNVAGSCEGQTLEDVKNLVNKYVEDGKITRGDAGVVVKNWKRSEHRRVERQLIKQKQRRCLYCRQSGHVYSNCPSRDEQSMGTGICFKCGSAEHTSGRCPRKNIKGFPYAVCFVCKQQGHLSRDCDNNPNGIYPDGGSCDLCGSQKHLKRDCPELKIQGQGQGKRLRAVMGTAMSGGDEDIILGGDESEGTPGSFQPPLKKPRKKVVQF